VAASALRRLNEINSDLVLPLAEKAIGNDDPHVREQGIDAYFARPSPQRAVFIVQLLDDPHPAVRGKVCGQLFRMAQIPEYNAPIREAAMALLTNASWRGQQQSALLLASLDHKPAASAMLALLESPRGEVMVAAAWGLRKLAVADTLPAMLDKAVRQTEVRKSSQWGIELDLQVAHLLEAMGIQKYAPAEPLLRKYIRKDYSMGDYSRGAAIWSLGQLFAGKQDRALSTQLVERLIDPIPPRPLEPPEIMRVRVMSAVTLGRMGAVEQLPLMRQYLGPKVTPVPSSLAIRWAVKELTGESLPQPEPEQVLQSWFLEPLDDNERGD
jgi:HEAT repeat protein